MVFSRESGLPLAAAASAQVEVLPTTIEGLDLSQLRSRLGSRDALLAAILRQFFQDFSHWSEQFLLARQAQDFVVMIRLAHTLKGAAANVSAPQVHEAALMLEMDLKQGKSTEMLIQHCDAALKKLLGVLQEKIPSEKPVALDRLAPEQVSQVIQEASGLLQRRRPLPAPLLQQLRSALNSVASEPQRENLRQQLAAFEFKKAQQTLAEIQQGLA